jgi:hypothetical protein
MGQAAETVSLRKAKRRSWWAPPLVAALLPIDLAVTAAVTTAAVRVTSTTAACVASTTAACVTSGVTAAVRREAAATTVTATIAAETWAIVSSTRAAEAIGSPAVGIAPVKPWADAEKDAIIEVSRTVKPIRSAGVGGVVIVAILADGGGA